MWRSVTEPLVITGAVGGRERRAVVKEMLVLVGLLLALSTGRGNPI
jgi:hypothetical protein